MMIGGEEWENARILRLDNDCEVCDSCYLFWVTKYSVYCAECGKEHDKYWGYPDRSLLRKFKIPASPSTL
jgi:hypothetical protein